MQLKMTADKIIHKMINQQQGHYNAKQQKYGGKYRQNVIVVTLS